MPITAVSVKGLKELQASIRRSGDVGLKQALSQANKAGASVVATAAAPLAPVGRTGKLKRSVRAVGSQRYGQVRAGGARVPYAAAIHWGRTRGNVGRPPGNRMGTNPIRGRPFLLDAARRSIPKVLNVYRNAFQRNVVDRINNGK